MRTTLTIEPDVAEKLRRRMAQTKLPLKQTINEALRLGLAQINQSKRSRKFRVEAHASGFFPGIDHDRMNQLADELEAESALDKLSR